MPFAPRVFALVLVGLVLAGCGARSKPAAAPSEPPEYQWAGFTGGATAPSVAAKQEAAPKAPEEKQVEKKDEKRAEKTDATTAPGDDEQTPVTDADPPKKVSATTVGGRSVSEVSADVFATAARRATHRNVVSTTVTVGAEYEQVSVVLENLAVQIVRPAATPDQAGPKVRSPKARKEDAADTTSALYDPRADVLLLVQADRKATSTQALAALVAAHGMSPARTKPTQKAVRAKQRQSAKGS